MCIQTAACDPTHMRAVRTPPGSTSRGQPVRRTLSVFVDAVGDLDEDMRNHVVDVHLEISLSGLPPFAPFTRSEGTHGLGSASAFLAPKRRDLSRPRAEGQDPDGVDRVAGGGGAEGQRHVETLPFAPAAACAQRLWPVYPAREMLFPAKRGADGVCHDGQVVCTFLTTPPALDSW
jgi:hypothetical protein